MRLIKYEIFLGQPLIAGIPRVQVDCQLVRGKNTLVAIAFGQSNSANFGEVRYHPRKDVYSFYEGNCFLADDPMPGADGGGGSVWGRLGDRLINSGQAERVVFATIGEGSSEIARWTAGGDLHGKLLRTTTQLTEHGLLPTHLLWQQGEADQARKTNSEHYRENFIKMIQSLRAHGISAPIYVSVSTYCKGDKSVELQQSQQDLVDIGQKIYPGPNTDQLISGQDRYDDCHFSKTGLERYSDAWLQSLIANPK